MPTRDRVLRSTADAPWLPAGGSAHVVLAPAGGDAAPHPTCLVRLLVTRPEHVLVVPRTDGGVDIPTSAVGSGTVAERLEDLVVRTTGTRRAVDLLGWVHNEVRTRTGRALLVDGCRVKQERTDRPVTPG